MGKAMTVTDTKTLWGEDPDKRNPCSTSICLNYSHFRVQSFLHSQFLHIFVWTIKTTPGGGHFHINLYGAYRFSGIIFQHKFLNLVSNRMFPHAVWLKLFCLDYQVRLRAPKKVIINWQSQPVQWNNSLSGVFQNKFLPDDF